MIEQLSGRAFKPDSMPDSLFMMIRIHADSAGDIEMARRADAAGCIGICWGTPEAAHLEAADVVISQLDEIQVVDD